jgi:acetylornithine deacetylase/succinyl-diaminopimelate desuccinylase-like protein
MLRVELQRRSEPAVDAEFLEDAVQMLANCVLAQSKGGGDFLVASGIGDEAEHFALAGSEAPCLTLSGIQPHAHGTLHMAHWRATPSLFSLLVGSTSMQAAFSRGYA